MSARAPLITGAVVAVLAAATGGAAGASCTRPVRLLDRSGAVLVHRGGRLVDPREPLLAADRIAVARGGRAVLDAGAERLVLRRATGALACTRAGIGFRLARGRLGLGVRTLPVVTGDGLLVAGARRVGAVVEQARAATLVRVTRGAVFVRRRRARGAVAVPATQTAIVDRRGVRLDTWPFARADDQFAPALSALPPYWADGRTCSTGCRPAGGRPGWPLRPFHRQHPLRAGLNELRPSGFHLGFDIQAEDRAPVFALAPGRARVLGVGTIDERVQVGSLIYWHVRHRVREGQAVRPFRTVLGVVLRGARHLHLSEVVDRAYLNPLRPGGRLLSPYADTAPPVIGAVRLYAGGDAVVDAFDPQSYVVRNAYETPVLAPAALAWRLYAASGRMLSPLEFALRSAQHLDGRTRIVFAPGARNPGWNCFEHRARCIPRWRYRLAGGLSGPVPLASLAPGRYRLAVYAWDYADNRSERDAWFRVGGARAARLVPAPAGAPQPAPDHP